MAKFFVIGNSVSANSRSGVWASGQSWGAQVTANAGFTPNILATPGATIADMQSQWNTVLAQFAAGDTVAIMPFENDINVTALKAARSTLEGQLDAAIAAGIPASRITINTPFIVNTSAYLQAAPPFIQAIFEVAFARGIPVIDVFGGVCELLATKPSVTPYFAAGDNGHPSLLGQTWIYSLYTLIQNSASAGYHPASITPPCPIGPPIITLTALHQTSGAGPTLLSAQVAYSDPVAAAAVSWNVQDYQPPSGEVALMLDGVAFPSSGSVTVTAAQFSRLMIAPCAHAHDIWINANNGGYNSGGSDFSVTPP